MLVEVYSFQGGAHPTCFIAPILTTYFASLVGGTVHSGDTKVPYLERKPAIDDEGNCLTFALDEVDHYAMDARMHFRTSDTGSPSSPKTIFDYVEQKMKKDRESSSIGPRFKSILTI